MLSTQLGRVHFYDEVKWTSWLAFYYIGKPLLLDREDMTNCINPYECVWKYWNQDYVDPSEVLDNVTKSLTSKEEGVA